MEESLDSWFEREILVHEAALVRYLKRMWPREHDVHDLRQEIYVRVYEAAAKARPTSPKSFLFTTTRHLMTDRVRRGRVVSIQAMGDLESLNVPGNERSPEEHLSTRQELHQLARALELLPPRCREVVWMRRVDEMPQRDVAEKLGIGQKTVEKHLMKGVRLLADVLYGNATAGTKEDDEDAIGENLHAQQHSD